MSSRFPRLAKTFGHKPVPDHYEPARDYIDLRNLVFATKPDAIGLRENACTSSVWGIVMESGYDRTVATLVALGDGAVSLYYSTGGGIIGLGGHDGPRRAAQELLESAPQFLQYCQPTAQHPLPRQGSTRFYLMTYGGVLTAEAAEQDLAEDRHSLSPLFHQGHSLLREALALDPDRSVE